MAFAGTSYFSTGLLSTGTLTGTCCISNNNLVYQRFVEITTEGSFETVSALCASFNTNSIAIPLRLHSWFNDQVATGCARYSTLNQQQVALSVNTYYVQALNGYALITQVASHFLAFEHFARSLVLTDRTRNAVRQGVTVGSVLGTEVPALNSASKTFTFRSTGNIDFLTSAKISTLIS